MGYKKIDSEIERAIFEDIWKTACEEMGFEFAPCADFTEPYFLQNDRSEIVGTVELIPYNPTVFSTIEKLFAFSAIPAIRQNADKTFEIDKLSLLKDVRGKHYISSFMYLFHDHARRHQVKYYIALIEQRFYTSLKRFYGMNIEQLGEPVIEKHSHLVPTLIDAEYICNHPESFPWYDKMFKQQIS